MADGKPCKPEVIVEVAPVLDGLLEEAAGRRLGFALLLFDFDQQDGTDVDYVSNATRGQMVSVIRAWLNHQVGAS